MNRWFGFAVAGALVWPVVALAAPARQDPRIQVSVEPAPVPDFELTDHQGQAFRPAAVRGRTALVFFGFTHCASICPAAMARMKLLAGVLGEGGREPPAVLLISVDGDRDTPEVLKTYLAGFPESFIGLTGDPKAVRKIAAGFKAVFFKGLPYDNAGNYQVEHTSMIYLVDPDGRIRATFLDAPVEAMAATVRQVAAKGP